MVPAEIRKYKSVITRQNKPVKSTAPLGKQTTSTKKPTTSSKSSEGITPDSLKPQGLTLGLKYAIFTALSITIASLILVIISYVSIRREVENEIDESGIMLTKVLASFDVSLWENMQDNNQLARIISEEADKRGIRLPVIINLLITTVKEYEFPVAGIRIKEAMKLGNPRFLRATKDGITIKELYYSEEGSAKQTRTRLYMKSILDKDGNETKYYIKLFLSAQNIDEVLNNLFIAFILPALLAIAIGAGIGLWMAQQVTKPLKNLMADMVEISQGNLDHQSNPVSHDEIEVLTKVFNQMTQRLKVAHEKELEAKAWEHELNIAQEIQTNLLPKKIPELPGYDIATYYRSSKEVGGDYYDIIPLNETNIGIVVADVSGKGVPGSMVMTMVRSLIRMEATRNISPANTLANVNRILAADIRRGMFVTVLYFILNTENKPILVSSAGHNPLIIWRKNLRNCELINPNGIALGFDRGPIFEKTIKEVSIQLNQGDRIVAYTDGIVETMNHQQEEFGNERFHKLINQLAETDSKLFINQVIKEIDTYQGSAPQHDDITLISVRFNG